MLIELKDVCKRFGHLVVLDRLNLGVQEGQSLVVIGASGSGKSVLLKHIVGLMRPDRGRICFEGRRIEELPERKMIEIRRRFGFLFQMGALFDSLNVRENVAFPLKQHTDKSDPEIHQIVRQKLAMVGLSDAEQKMPAELSGGQRKRVALARAIALDPQVILYDEPTTGLDPIRADVINQLILKLRHELNVTSIVVTHDMASAFKVADRIVMLHEGKIIADATPREIQDSVDPVVRQFVGADAAEIRIANDK